MAKPTKDHWKQFRDQWERDKRDGHQWLADELSAKGFDVTRAAIAKAAKRQGWAKKSPGKSEAKKVTRSDKSSDKTSLKNVTLPRRQVTKQKPTQDDQPEWEEVDESEQKIHGNSLYLPSHDRQVYLLCQLGATDAEIAEFFEVTEQTINNWKKWYRNFFESMKAGKLESDAQTANSLYRRANGYKYEEVRTKAIRPMAEPGEEGEIQAASGDELIVVEVVTTVKEVPPDTSAAFLWLKNRRPKDWRDKREVEVSGKVDKELLAVYHQDVQKRLEEARQRQRLILIERGIITEETEEEV